VEKRTKQVRQFCNDLKRKGVKADFIGLENKIPRAFVIKISINNSFYYLKVYNKENQVLANHEQTLLSMFSSINKSINFKTPQLIIPPKIIVESLNKINFNYPFFIMTCIEGQPLSTYNYSTAKISSILCDIADTLYHNTRNKETNTTNIKIHRGQGIFTFITKQGYAIPNVKAQDHFREFNLLVKSQGIIPNKILNDFLSYYQYNFKNTINQTMIVHNDLHIDNVIKKDDNIGLIDFGCSFRSNPLSEYGGILAHIGYNQKDYVLRRMSHTLNCNIGPDIIFSLNFFCLKRALRRLVYLYKIHGLKNPESILLYKKQINTIKAIIN
jgi:hypothetical protein